MTSSAKDIKDVLGAERHRGKRRTGGAFDLEARLEREAIRAVIAERNLPAYMQLISAMLGEGTPAYDEALMAWFRLPS